MPYSPIILPDFNENEYVNRSNEDEDVPEPVPIPALVVAPNIEVANLAKEAEDTVADAFEERSVEEIGGDDGENADRDPIPKLWCVFLFVNTYLIFDRTRTDFLIFALLCMERFCFVF